MSRHGKGESWDADVDWTVQHWRTTPICRSQVYIACILWPLRVYDLRSCSPRTAMLWYFLLYSFALLWSPYVIGQTIIFLPCSFFLLLLSSFFIPRLISAAAGWMSTILWHIVWPSCEFRMQVWKVLHAARCKCRTQKKSPKIAIWAPSRNFVGLYLRN